MQLSAKEKNRLKGKYGEWAIVTGAGSGIGLALAMNLASAGFNLIINGRNEAKLNEAAQSLNKFGRDVLIVSADLSTSEGVHQLIQASSGKHVGLLVNNAGFGSSGWFSESSIVDEMNMLHVNCEAVLALTHHFIRRFQLQHRGGIIFLSSLVAFQGVPYAAHYAATKAYVQTLSEGLARELAGTGVDILAAAPGPVESGFGQAANMKMGKAAKADDIAPGILMALGRTSTVVPGWMSKVLTYALRTAPRPIKVRIMEKVMGGFTKHQRDN